MSEHHASVTWKRESRDFTYDSYNRAHEVSFKNADIIVPASAAPAFKGDADRVDPEESFVASLSSCHMLTFLAICARKRLTVDGYTDDAVGFLEREGGKLWITRVELHPIITFAPGVDVDEAVMEELHHLSHEECFIASSVKTNVVVVTHG